MLCFFVLRNRLSVRFAVFRDPERGRESFLTLPPPLWILFDGAAPEKSTSQGDILLLVPFQRAVQMFFPKIGPHFLHDIKVGIDGLNGKEPAQPSASSPADNQVDAGNFSGCDFLTVRHFCAVFHGAVGGPIPSRN